MKVCFSKIIRWIFSFVIFLTLHGISAQPADSALQDLLALCSEQQQSQRNPNCDWLDAYKQQNAISEIIQQFSADDNIQYRPVRNHISPRYANYEGGGKDLPQYPFSSGWKSQLNRLLNNWNNPKSTQAHSKKPFSYDSIKRTAPNMFSSWGGKRTSVEELANKREPAFSSWGGKRTQKFFNWGGKRSVPENELSEVASENNEHNVMKRSVNAEDEPYREKRATDKKLCITDEINLQELFKEFIEWSRRQPEQKKGSFYKKMFTVSTLHSPDNMSRRAGSFFQWGGKRSLGTKQN